MAKTVETNIPFSESQIWDFQRDYFETMGFEAWRQGEVPHYVTTNPRQANAYAEMAISLYQDLKEKRGGKAPAQIQILEVGGGAGRFAYYFLKRLHWHCKNAGIPIDAFRYILSDFAQKNLDFWKIHPRFSDFFEAGVLDIACFDAVQLGPLELQFSEETIGEADLDAPIIVVANYLFDSIPQELIYFGEEGAQRCLATLNIPEQFETAAASAKLAEAELSYRLEKPNAQIFESDWLNNLLSPYLAAPQNGFVLFPAYGLECLAYLKNLSKAGMLLMSADKGSHTVSHVIQNQPPALAAHGSFSLNANFHALAHYCEQTGGRTVFPSYPYKSINTGCLLFLEETESFGNCWRTAQNTFAETGPGIYYGIYRSFRNHLNEFQIDELMHALRLGLYDSHQLAVYSPMILKMISNYNEIDKEALLSIFSKCWDNYFALAEERDFGLILGSLCYEMDAYEAAIFYFEKSTNIYGAYSGTFYNLAVCYFMLGKNAVAKDLLEQVLAHDPQNQAAKELMEDCFSQTPQFVH